MTMSSSVIEEATAAVLRAHAEQALIEESGLPVGLTQSEAYHVQYEVVKALRGQGQRVIGRKVAFTSQAVQAMFDVNEPVAGHLLNTHVYDDGAVIPTSTFTRPLVEPEVTFVLARELKGPGVTPLDVLRATEGVTASFELGNMFSAEGLRLTVTDQIAYNSGAAGIILSPQLKPLQGLDLRYEGLTLERNAELIASGTGSEVMGNPLNSVAWLANKLAEFDDYLQAGEIILSGSITAGQFVKPGDHVCATFTRLGSVEARFI